MTKLILTRLRSQQIDVRREDLDFRRLESDRDHSAAPTSITKVFKRCLAEVMKVHESNSERMPNGHSPVLIHVPTQFIRK